MTICSYDHHACDCQPDEGVPCRKDRAMTHIDELVKRARSVADHAFSGTPQFVAELADAIESQSAELTRFRERNAELVKENAQLRGHREQLSKAIDGVLVVNRSEYAKARIASIEATVRELREALTTMRDAVQQWCDAVDRDSSWDGWDHHFKAVKWELLPATNAALASSESVGKSEGENDGVE